MGGFGGRVQLGFGAGRAAGSAGMRGVPCVVLHVLAEALPRGDSGVGVVPLGGGCLGVTCNLQVSWALDRARCIIQGKVKLSISVKISNCSYLETRFSLRIHRESKMEKEHKNYFFKIFL
jgi:hypothetical protein